MLAMPWFWSLRVAAPQCRPSSQTSSRCSQAPSDPPEARPVQPRKPCRRACGETNAPGAPRPAPPLAFQTGPERHVGAAPAAARSRAAAAQAPSPGL